MHMQPCRGCLRSITMGYTQGGNTQPIFKADAQGPCMITFSTSFQLPTSELRRALITLGLDRHAEHASKVCRRLCAGRLADVMDNKTDRDYANCILFSSKSFGRKRARARGPSAQRQKGRNSLSLHACRKAEILNHSSLTQSILSFLEIWHRQHCDSLCNWVTGRAACQPHTVLHISPRLMGTLASGQCGCNNRTIKYVWPFSGQP